MSNKKRLYKFHWDCGRMGDLDGVFVATTDDVAAAIGREVYFGEVLGKHSEIYGTLDAEHITEITADTLAVQVIETYFGGGVGFHPLLYFAEEDEG